MWDHDLSRRITATRLLAWWRGREPAASVTVAVVVALALRLPFLGVPVYPDEGGYLLVARQWRSGGPFLYGDLFVDRPPLLLVVFRVADALGGIVALRLIATGLVVVMVVVAGWAGWMVASARGARWAALVAAALASSPLLGTAEADGELLTVPLVMLSCALVIAASRPHVAAAVRIWYAASAGLTATAAMMVKQNFAEALVFAAVLLTASVVHRLLPRSTAARVLAAYAAGAAVPPVCASLWAVIWGSGLADLWYTLYGFRWQALDVIRSEDLIPQDRLATLLLITLKSGMVVLATVFVVALRRELRRLEPVVVAVAVTLGVAVVSIGLGASYWTHYLIELVPPIVLAGGRLAGGAGQALGWARAGVALVVVSAVVAVHGAVMPSAQPPDDVVLEDWLHDAATPSDSAMVAYGHANLIEASGLQPAYRQLWSLPMRVLDPGLEELSATLTGPRPPTWVVEWDDFDDLGSESAGRLRSALASRYRRVVEVCGHAVYLLRGARRSLPATPAGCGPG